MKFKGKVLLAVFLVSALMVASASHAATQKQPILVALWGGSFLKAYQWAASKFTEETGIPVEFELHTPGHVATAQKIIMAFPKHEIDLVMCVPGTGGILAFSAGKKKVAAVIAEDDVPNLKAVPKQFKSGGLVPGETDKYYWLPLYNTFMGWVYRPDLVKGTVNSLQELFDKKYEKKIAVPYVGYGSGAFLVSMAVAAGGNEKNIDSGFKGAKKLAQTGNIAYVYTTEAECTRGVSTGDVSVFFGGYYNAYSLLKEKLPLQAINNPTDHKVMGVAITMSPINGPQLSETKRFMNFILRPDVQSGLSGKMFQIPVHPDAEPDASLKPLVPDSDNVYMMDVETAKKQIETWTKRWEKEVLPLIK
ncbi:MAG: extracellular solute-binding protein [Desulfobacterales bacterium]|nr:MAG: extracellular solute-binding protein [Desulfobacterales bacterium]